MPTKVLVIDDDPGVSKGIDSILGQRFPGSDVFSAQRTSDAFDRLHIVQPDVIFLSDTFHEGAEGICQRLLEESSTSRIPVAVMAKNGKPSWANAGYQNLVGVLGNPPTEEFLLEALRTAGEQAAHSEVKPKFSADPAKIVFSGHTGFFPIRSALQMAAADRLNGVLRFFIHRTPIELFLERGRFLLATTRDSELYLRESPVILPSTNLGTILKASLNQELTGCPLFLHISSRGGFAHEDVVQITREHGQRVFSHLWTAGRVHFEFERLEQFPDYLKNFEPGPEDPDNWVLRSLRFVRFDDLRPGQRPEANGSPAYTRKGYELIQRLRLNEVEARFATAVNGTESLQTIAKRIAIPLNDALLIVFRFVSLDIIEYWSQAMLSLPNSPASISETPAPTLLQP